MTLAAITAKNRAAKILLDADKPLTYYTILSKWGVRTIPSKREIQQVLAWKNYCSSTAAVIRCIIVILMQLLLINS